jgi:hypothetical protein
MRHAGVISLYQKLIDVIQTLIRNPNPLKNNLSSNPGKTKQNPISVNFFFLNSISVTTHISKENLL